VAGILVIALIGGGIGAYLVMRGAKPPSETVAHPSTTAPAETTKISDAKTVETERARAEKAAADKAAAERAAAERAAAEKAAAEKAAAEKLAAEKAAAETRAAEQATESARAEREAAAAKEAARKVLEAKTAAERVARARQLERRVAEPKQAPREPAVPEKVAVATQPAPAPPTGDAAAFSYYRDLAHRGDSGAALTLGEIYESGRGVGASNNWAYLWYSVAERRGAAGAKPKKDAVASRLQPKEIEQLDRQVRGIVEAGK
jgi:hypothetical protein